MSERLSERRYDRECVRVRDSETECVREGDKL